MLTKKQISEIKEHLNRAQNPLFFFDNDQDGLCSFLLLQRFIQRGKGVAVKLTPLNKNYFRKINELNPDYVFILDVPTVDKNFWEEIEKINLPVVWIDHHKIDKKEIPEFVDYYNPLFNKNKTNEPVTALCDQITNRKQDLWIGVAGCISDKFFPEFYSDFKKQYPDLGIDSKDAFEIFYGSQIGKISKIFGSGLKDRTTNVIKMLNYLTKVQTPYEVLEESEKNYFMHKRFKEINEKYKKFLEKAKLNVDESNLLFFKYAGDTSMSADLANGLKFSFPEKIIVVAYVKESKINVSVRGENIRDVVLKVIGNLEGARGGGHKNAVGVQIKVKDLDEFKKRLEKLIKNK